MENRNHIREPFLLLLFAALFFVGLSFFKSPYTFATYKFKAIDFLSDLRLDTAESSENKSRNSTYRKSTLNQKEYESEAHHFIEFAADSSGGLGHFFQSLDLLKSGKKNTVRVAYFGDSMIENDFITQELRKLFQQTFGGNGVGFVPVTSISSDYRKTIKQTFSENWKTCELNETQTHPTGISGYTYVPAWKGATDRKNNSSVTGNSWVKFIGNNLPGLNSFQNVRMFYGPALGTQSLLVNEQSFLLTGISLVNEVKLSKGNPLESFYISFQCENPLDVYGFSFDSKTGVFIDNFSLRGQNGLTLSAIPVSVLSGLNKYLNYDLVVFQFGINVLDTKMGNFKWYENGMQSVVAHFREAFPGTSILIISASDRGFNENGNWTTNPEIPQLVESQKKCAKKSGSGFWNLYEAMGGFESMTKKWVKADTALANKDYTHFNLKGSDRVGEMLYHDLISEYNLYIQYSQQQVR